MAMSAEYVAEIALINLSFAMAELEMAGTANPSVIGAMEHVGRAISNLKRLAPNFDGPCESGEPAEPQAA